MKIILVLIFLIPSLSYAVKCVNKIAKSEYIKRQAKIPNAGFLTCKDLPQEPCLCFDGKDDDRRWKLGLIDDLEKPILRAPKDSPVLLDCDDFSNCSSKAMNPDDDPLTDDNVCLADNSQPKWDELINHPNVTNLIGPWFIWCEKETGSFEQKDEIVPDIQGSIDADAEDLKIKQDNDKRSDARVISEAALLQCFQDTKNPTVSPIQVKECLNALAMKVLGSKIPIEQID